MASTKWITLSFAVTAFSAWGQTPSADVFRPSRGFQPAGSYSISETESVNDTTGNVSLKIPLAQTPPGKSGHRLGLSLSYNSALFDLRTQAADADHVFGYTATIGPVNMLAPADLSKSGGWQYNYRYALETDTRACFGGAVCTRVSLLTGDGGSHALWMKLPNPNQNDTAGYSQYDLTGRTSNGSSSVGTNLTYFTSDGSFIRVEVAVNPGANYSGAWRAIFPNGDYVSGILAPQGSPKDADQVCDRNDNCTLITNTIDPATSLIATTELTDAYGRKAVISHSNPTQTTGIDEIRALRYGATENDPRNDASSLLTKVYWKTVSFGVAAQAVDGNSRGMTYKCPAADQSAEYTCVSFMSIRVIEKIELPNGLSYTFAYADASAPTADRGQGELLEMRLPASNPATAAKVHYRWSRREVPIIGSSPVDWFAANTNPLEEKQLTWQAESGEIAATPAPERTWSYQIGTNQSHITAPDGGITSHYFRDRYEQTAWDRGLVHKTVSPAGTTWRCWQRNEPYIGLTVPADSKNPYVMAEYRQLAGGTLPTAATSFEYDKNGNLMTRREYDWVEPPESDLASCTVTGTVLRRTENRYWNPVGGAASPTLATAAPTDPNLVNAYYAGSALPKRDSLLEARIYFGVEGNPANAKAVTQYEYDNPNVTGNITRELRWDNQLVGNAPAVAATGVTLSELSAMVTARSYVPGRKGLIETETDPNSNTTKYVYGAVRPHPVQTCPSALTDLYPSSVTAAFGRPEAQVRQYFYDCATGVLNDEVFESNQNVRTSYVYDRYGRVTSEIQGAEQSAPNRKSTSITEYDDLDRTVRTVQDGKLASISYYNQLGEQFLHRENGDGDSSPITVTGSSGTRTVTVSRTFAGTAHYTLESNPHANGVTDAEPTMGWTLRKLDRAGRVEQVSHYRGAALPEPFGPNSNLTGTVTYNYAGLTTTVTNPESKVRTTTVDALGRLKTASEGGVTLATYEYDVLDNLISVTMTDNVTYSPQQTQTRTFVYSSLGRLVSANNPEADAPTTYTYYSNGTLKVKTDPRGVTATNSLIDGLGRILRTDYSPTVPVTPDVRFCYDGKRYDLATDGCVSNGGRPLGDRSWGALTHTAARKTESGITTSVSETEYAEIDPLGRVLTSRQTTNGLDAKSFSYQYWTGGALERVTYPSHRVVTYDVNGANRVTQVRNGVTGTNYMQSMQYKPSGSMSSATVGTWSQTREYNSRLQARSLTVQNGGASLLGLRWIYSGNYDATFEETGTDNNGDVRHERLQYPVSGSQQVVMRRYDYDAANRLTNYCEPWDGTTCQPGKRQQFGYDRFGNMWQEGSNSGGVPDLRQNGSSWYVSGGAVRNRLASTAYDAAGNQLQLSASPGTSASYDAESRMSRIDAGWVATYEYDAEGRRVKKTVSGVATWYVYGADGELMAEYGPSPDASGTKYVVSDALGSPRLLLDAQGNCKGRLDFAPYGALVPHGGDCQVTAPESGSPMFTGQMRDGESAAGTPQGLDYFGARMYWASIGRFTSVDPQNAGAELDQPGTWNGYGYVNGNPLTYTDPMGLGLCGVDPSSETGAERPYCLEMLHYEWWQRKLYESWRGSSPSVARDEKRTSIAPVMVAGVVPTGQEHHAIGRVVYQALQRHPLLRNLYTARDPRFVTRAINQAAHRGYQTWHRVLDKQVAKWIDVNRAATSEQFERYLRNLYNNAAELVKRFPNGLNSVTIIVVPDQLLNMSRCGRINCGSVGMM